MYGFLVFEMQGYQLSFVHLLYAIILAQFVLIAVLLGGFSMEYLSNDYYRGWVDSNYPWLSFLLQGQLGALLIGIGLGGTVLLIMAVRNDRRVETQTGASTGMLEAANRIPNNSIQDQPIARTVAGSRQEKPEDVMSEVEKQDA